MPDATPDKPVPYHAFETRQLSDSEGRRIELRQLVPGSPDPGRTVFRELTGIARLVLTIAGIPHDVPVPFNIPYGDGGVPDVMAAFKVFDKLAEKALKHAQETLERRFREKQIAEGSQIVLPSRSRPLQPGMVSGL